MIYAAAADGALAAFEAQTGKQKWRISANKAGLSAGVGADDGLIVVGTARGEVLAFDDAGKPKLAGSGEQRNPRLAAGERRPGGGAQQRQPDLCLFGGRRQAPMALSAGGARAGIAQFRRHGCRPGGQVYVGFPGGKLVALTGSSGSVRWEATVALSKGTTELERIADISSAPVINGREVCAVAFQGRAACFDGATGQPLWTRDISSAAGMAAGRALPVCLR